VSEERRAELEAAMMKAMGHSLYQAYLMNSGLDNSSPMASGPWGEQIKMMVGEFGPALKEMGLME
jgi:tripartite-type tricarboxylate transporter receptor subunit TctC